MFSWLREFYATHKNHVSLADDGSYSCNDLLRGDALDLWLWDFPKMLFMWAAICHWTVMTLADMMVENEVTDTEMEGSKCHIAGFISPPLWEYMNT